MIDRALKKIKGRGWGYCPLCVTIALSLHESIRNTHAKDSWLIPKTLFMNMLLWQSLIYLGSVWIKLILLKLKIKNWKYCSKIIFKCVNSVMEPIFNEKVVEKSEIYGYCSWVPQTPLFINFFIKNWSHNTIYIFKNYFATAFSVFSFQFQQNKFYPNIHILLERSTYLFFCVILFG